MQTYEKEKERRRGLWFAEEEGKMIYRRKGLHEEATGTGFSKCAGARKRRTQQLETEIFDVGSNRNTQFLSYRN
jgi:hypothetical protein